MAWALSFGNEQVYGRGKIDFQTHELYKVVQLSWKWMCVCRVDILRGVHNCPERIRIYIYIYTTTHTQYYEHVVIFVYAYAYMLICRKEAAMHM